jgi:hypothetical protein
MKISYCHSSGWCPARVLELNTETLPAQDKQQIEQLVLESGILTCTGELDEGLRDGDEYTIEISVPGSVHTWQWYGAGSPEGPEALVSLLAYLRTHSTKKA